MAITGYLYMAVTGSTFRYFFSKITLYAALNFKGAVFW